MRAWSRAASAAALALLLVSAAAFTVDCDKDYADCDKELSKLTEEDDVQTNSPVQPTTSTTAQPYMPPIKKSVQTTEKPEIRELLYTSDSVKPNNTNMPKGRLLNISMDELQSLANALHNRTKAEVEPVKKEAILTDLSDVSLDSDDEFVFPPHNFKEEDSRIVNKALQVDANPSEGRLGGQATSSEIETCHEGGIAYKVGEKINRGCEESCGCIMPGAWECTPRCNQPYIRRGRRLADPLCFETPVDDCCSIIACATTDTDHKTTPSSGSGVCHYGNTNYTKGQTWEVGCEQRCLCEATGVVACKPRCRTLSPSEHCINMQDPNDSCCQVQACDVTHDAHEHRDPHPPPTLTTIQDRMDTFINDIVTSTAVVPTIDAKSVEPVASLTVLKNNSIYINMARSNSSDHPFHLQLSRDKGKTFEDVVLNNEILENLDQGLEYVLKTKETGKVFNFIIPLTDVGANDLHGTHDVDRANKTSGCISEGVFYKVGEEFRIGCSELCECTGPNQRECAALECPSHVGLELLSPTCVRWAPEPPDWVPDPPACCPSKMRCLSDGSCDYHGNKIPNWSEVPVSLTGCELRCFCETGTLDCQNICSPLPTLPPQTLRCQPGYHPGPVNISDDDCCKQWGCIPNAEPQAPSQSNHSTSVIGSIFVTPLPPPIVERPKQIITPDQISPIHDQMLFKKDKLIFSKFKTPNILIKIPTGISGIGTEDHSQPKLVHSVDYLIHKPVPAYSFPGPVANNDVVTIPPTNDDLRAKYPLVTKGKASVVANHLSIDHSASSTEKWYQTESPTISTNFAKVLKVPGTSTSIPISTSAISKEKDKPTVIQNFNSIKYFEPNVAAPTLSRVKPIRILTSPPRDIQMELFNDKFSTVNPLTYPYNKRLQLSNIHETPRENHKTKMSYYPVPKIPHIPRAPNPYQQVLLHRLTPKPISSTAYKYDLNSYTRQDFRPTYSPENLDVLLSQLEQAERSEREHPSEINDRPTMPDSRLQGSKLGNQLPDKQKPQPPPFIPTIPPDAIRFPAEEDPGDLGQNNDIHRQQTPSQNIPPFPIPPLRPPGGVERQDNKKLNLVSLASDSPTSVKMLFELSPVLVGLRGSVDLRYTDKDDEDISHWYSQVFAPADEVLTTARLEFRLSGLRPSTIYKIRGKLYLHNLPLEPVSAVYTVRTLDLTTQVMEEKRRAVQSGVRVQQVNATAAQLSWRHFTEDELQYIDGIQVRYRPLEQPIYTMTEVLHHSRVSAELLELRPGARYEASLVLVPPPRSSVELFDSTTLNFTTPVFYDMYNWSVTVEANKIGAKSVEVSWHGVPAPPERYVRVYRAAHSCDDKMAHAHHKERDTFKLADRDQPPNLLLNGLRPNTKCRVWLELFLANGKVKISNVLDITTKTEESENEIDNEVQASSVAGSRSGVHGDYYSALVVVGVVAALGTLTSLLLLLVVMRRHRPHSISITTVPSAPREPTLPPYDNPAYKLELQQETMDL